MSNKIKTISTLLLPCLFLVGIFGGCEEKNEGMKELENEKVINDETKTEENTEDEIESVQDLVDGEYQFEDVDTSNWKTYRNEEMGFEVKIPSNWFCGGVALDPDSKKSIACLDEKNKRKYYSALPPHGFNIVLLNSSRGHSKKDYKELIRLTKEDQSMEEKIYSIDIMDEKAILINEEEIVYSVYLYSKKKITWEVTFFANEKKYKAILDGILQTFEFTE